MARGDERPEDVCIVSCGARTAAGLDVPSTAAAVRAGIAPFAEHPFMIDRYGQPMIVARDAALPVEAAGPERLEGMLVAALKEAAACLEGRLRKEEKIPLFLALPPLRPGQDPELPAKVVKALTRAFQDPLSFSEIVPFPAGHAGGFLAVQEALRRFGRRETELAMVAGADSYLNAETLEWLDQREQLKSEKHPWGFIPGEAAGACLLAPRRMAAGHRWSAAGALLHSGSAKEEHLIHTDAVCLGRGLTEAIRKTLELSAAPGEKVEHTWCDLNGQPYRADEFGYTVTRVAKQFEDPTDFTAPADCLGDVGAATGPLLLALALAAGRKGYATGSRQLLWTSSDGGERAAVLLRLETSTEGN